MTDIIVPIWSPNIPQEKLAKLVLALTQHTDNYRLILCGSSKSQPKNINYGLKIAKSKYIVILDWDVYVSDGWLDQLIDDLKNNKEIGIIGAKMIGKYTGLNSQSNILQEWPTLAGGCMVFKNIGLRWDENFPSGYWADTDFCRQYKEKGYQVWIDGTVEVEHEIHTSGSSEEGEKYYLHKWGDSNL